MLRLGFTGTDETILNDEDLRMNTGLDALSRNLKELEKAIDSLDGDIAHLSFNQHDPQSIEGAIQQLYSTIDRKLSLYKSNSIVMTIAAEIKERGRQAIIDRASAARLAEEQDHQEE